MSSKIHVSKELENKVREEVIKEMQITEPERTVPNFDEIGITGLYQFAGIVQEEFLPQLRWPRAAKIYQEMELNDPVVGAVLYVCEQLIRRIDWSVRKGGPQGVDEEAAEFLKSCLDDMSVTWADTIAEILTMLPYGFSWHEEVYKVRGGDTRNPITQSKYNDGRIGWRRLPARAQATIDGWIFAEETGDILGAVQQAAPDYKTRVLPMEKCLLFRTKYRYNNPEGRSLLRNAYRPWYFKKHIEEIEGIGIERDLAGLPVLQPPEGVDIWNKQDDWAVQMKNKAENLVRNIRRDQNEGVVIPGEWTLQLLSTGSRRQFDTNMIINRYDQRIATTLLADIIMLGADKVGSFALAEVKRSLMSASLDALVQAIADVLNKKAIPRLFKLNSFPGITDYPQLKPQEISTPHLNELARFIQALAGAKMPLFPDEDLEEFFRSVIGMPSLKDKSPQERQEQLQILDLVPRGNGQGHPTGVDTRPDDGRQMNTGLPQGAR